MLNLFTLSLKLTFFLKFIAVYTKILIMVRQGNLESIWI